MKRIVWPGILCVALFACVTLDSRAQMAISPKGKVIALADSDGRISFCNLKTGSSLGVVLRHSWEKERSRIQSLAISQDERLVATGDDKGRITIWDANKSGTERLTIRTRATEKMNESGAPWRVSSIFFTPDGRSVIATISDGAVQKWDVATGKLLQSIRPAGIQSWSYALSLAHDGTQFAVGTGREIELWNLRTGEFVRPLYAPRNQIGAPIFSPDGKYVAAIGHVLVGGGTSFPTEFAAIVWDAQTGKVVHELPVPQKPGEKWDYWITAVEFGSTAKLLITADSTGSIRTWDLESGKNTRVHAQKDAEMYGLMRSADGTLLIGNRYGALTAWSIDDHKTVWTNDWSYRWDNFVSRISFKRD
jgi:WD40 repeat protein